MNSRRSILRGAAGTLVGSGLLSAGTSSADLVGPPDPEYTIYSDLKEPADVNVRELNAAIAAVEPGSPLVGLADACLAVQENRGINAVYQVAHAAHESAWGCSQIAREKNNLFGWSAFDRCPGRCADSFESYEACVYQVMEFIDNRYLTEGGEFYEGRNLESMNINYATDPRWAEKIVTKMNDLAAAIAAGPSVATGTPSFDEDDLVKATDDAPTRATARRSGDNVVATVDAGTRGRLAEGPYENDEDDATWWWIEWRDGQLGWVAQEHLVVPDRVVSTGPTNVRTTAEISSSNVTFTQPAGIEGTVARFAGLYGPGRYRLERYLDGPVTAGYLNLVHREDAAGAVRFLLDRDCARGEVVLVVDDEPVEKHAFADWLAAEAGRDPPPRQSIEERLAGTDLSATARDRIRAQKRCVNDKLQDLGYALTYSTFREGYREAIETYTRR